MRLAEVSAEYSTGRLMFPPGLARLLIRPVSTGSGVPTITIGTVFVRLPRDKCRAAPRRHQEIDARGHSSPASRGNASGSPWPLLYLKTMSRPGV